MSAPETIMIDDIKYVRADSVHGAMAEKVDNMNAVLVRSRDSGVHFGYLKLKDASYGLSRVELVDSRRVWSWTGAASLSQVAMDGVTGGNISMVLPEITIYGVCEVIPLTAKAVRNLYSQKVWKR